MSLSAPDVLWNIAVKYRLWKVQERLIDYIAEHFQVRTSACYQGAEFAICLACLSTDPVMSIQYCEADCEATHTH
jgi:hypothetical protein